MYTFSSIIFKKIKPFFTIIIFVLFFSSCGLKTPPQHIPEKKTKSTIENFKVIQKGKQIRISWEITQKEREKNLQRYYKYSYDNDSQMEEIFGSKNTHFQMLKNRLPIFALNRICKWYEENFDKVSEREDALMNWYKNQFKDGKEKEDAFSKFSNNENIADYFIIKEKIKPFECIDCKMLFKGNIVLSFTSKSIIREGNNFFYYLDIPKNGLFFREFELTHHEPEGEILSPVIKQEFRQANLFPKIPTPTSKIIQIEDEKQTFKFAFGKVVIKKTTIPDIFNKNENELLSNFKIKKTDRSKVNEMRTFLLRISWPKIYEVEKKRLIGDGNYFEENKLFHVNLYRRRIGENWPESPINFKSSKNNYFLDKIKLYLYSASSKNIMQKKPNKNTEKIPFYIDFQGQNSDNLLYQIRLVDSFGNESSSSQTISINLPKDDLDLANHRNRAGAP